MSESKREPLLLDQYFSVLHLSLARWLAAAFYGYTQGLNATTERGTADLLHFSALERSIVTGNVKYLSFYRRKC